MKRILILFAHPTLEKSVINQAMLQAAAGLEQVTVRDLYEIYPDFLINVETEQALLLEHDIIIFQYPLFWYQTPSLLKEWMDSVYTYGFAFGRSGSRLQNKTLLCALTTGAKEEAYTSPAHAPGTIPTIRQFLLPIAQSAAFCGMQFLAPFVIYGMNELKRESEHYREVLIALRDEMIDLERAKAPECLRLNADWRSLLKK